MHNHVELSRRAERDLRRLGRGPERQRIVEALQQALIAVPPPDNRGIKALAGAAPWLRLRVGSHRILYRPLTPDELTAVRARGVKLTSPDGFLVERIVHRRDLDQAVTSLN